MLFLTYLEPSERKDGFLACLPAVDRVTRHGLGWEILQRIVDNQSMLGSHNQYARV